MKNLLIALALFCGVLLNAQEICNNGIDDDGDGLVDINDPDCLCNTTPIPSIIPNASFENYESCPTSYSQLDLCTGWTQPTNATTDYYNCGYLASAIIAGSGLDIPPDGAGMVGAIFLQDWKEYLGACLMSPMQAGTNYQLTFDMASLPISGDGSPCNSGNIDYGPISITIFGSENCLNGLLDTADSPELYSTEWEAIGSAVYTPTSQWGQFTINFTPTRNINAIMIGAPTILPGDYPFSDGISCIPYFLIDDLLLNEASYFGSYISETGKFCNNNLVLKANPTVPLSAAATYQWYLNGIAITGATQQSYSVPQGETNIGTYSVMISDAQCYISAQYTISAAVTAPFSTTIQPDCTNNGSISITTIADFYSFDGGTTWSSNATLGNLPPGNYPVKIKYNSGCESNTAIVTLNQPQYLDWPSISYDAPTCITGGTIRFTTTAAQYSFDNGATWTTNPIKTNVPAGIYQLIYKNNEGCISQTYTLYLEMTRPWIANYESINPMCNAPGSITVRTTGSAYSFDGGATWGTSPTKNNLPAGIYSIMIKDADGCESYATEIYLYESLLPYPEYIQSQEGCGGGSITFTTIADQYSFDGGITWTTNPVRNDLPEGYYQLVVKNAAGCVSYATWVYIYSYYPVPGIPEINVTSPTNCTDATGTITINSLSAQYSFDNGLTWTGNNIKTLLPPGTYYIIIKNEYGCQSPVKTAIINAPASAPAAPGFIVTDPTCTLSTGSISITDTADFYTFDNGTTWVTQNTKSSLQPGNYHIAVKNADGCISSSVVAIVRADTGAPDAPEAAVQQPNCHVNTGIITITTAAQQYSFDNGLTWSTTNSSAPLPIGTYEVKIINTAGCTSPALTVIVTPDIVLPPVVNNITYCKDVVPAALEAIGTNLLWYDQPSGGLGTATPPLPQTIVPGIITYYVSQSINNCESDRAILEVTVLDILPPPTVSNVVYCQDAVTIPLSGTGSNLQWYNDPFAGSPYAAAPIPSSAVAGTFIYYVSQSAYGCESVRVRQSVTILPTPGEPVTQDYVSYKHNTPTVPLTATGTDVKWFDHNLTALAAAPTPSATKIGTTYYYVSQTVDGCESPLVKITVEILPNYITIKYPLYFTPNGDAHNEKWNIYHPENGVKATIFIFDRYGKIITQLSAPGSGWDGTLNGNPLPATDYWFKVLYKEYGQEKTFSAHFSLIR